MSVRSGLIFALQVAVIGPLQGQSPPVPDPTRAWVTVGAGAGSGGTGGFAAVGGLDLLSRHALVSLRATGVAALFDDDFWDVGLLYGPARSRSHALVAASAGLGLMGGQRCSGFLGGTCRTVRARVGLPLAVRAAWNASRNLGLGIYTFADINGEQSFAGAAVSIQLGRVR